MLSPPDRRHRLGRRRRSQEERSKATRNKLVVAAREVFGSRGYHATPAEDVVRQAGLTSGALYHHFTDKRGLFRAAVEGVELEIAERVRVAAGRGGDPWHQLENGIREYLRACSEPDVRTLVLVDGPSVLGWEDWRKLDESFHLRPLAAVLAAAMRVGLIARRPPVPLARIILGALTEAGLASTDDRPASDAAMFWLIRRMRSDPTEHDAGAGRPAH